MNERQALLISSPPYKDLLAMEGGRPFLVFGTQESSRNQVSHPAFDAIPVSVPRPLLAAQFFVCRSSDGCVTRVAHWLAYQVELQIP
mmetsp:Transcript_121797/g.355910  ORF Transcript_121797/g.355910 Transcript_121797/m.355910 type:complete len:87 (-) Transcript_121797:87-347(-)